MGEDQSVIGLFIGKCLERVSLGPVVMNWSPVVMNWGLKLEGGMGRNFDKGLSLMGWDEISSSEMGSGKMSKIIQLSR